MSNENENTISRKELKQLIESSVNSALYSQQATRVGAIKETSLLHYFNLGTKSKDFLKTAADLGLAIVDAGLSITTSFIQCEIVRPSLDSDNIAKWLWKDARQDEPIIIADHK
jgi:hypothetical protein